MLVGMFLLAQVVGLGVINSYISAKSADGSVDWKELPSIAGYGLERPDVAPETSVLYIVLALLIGTVLILLIVRWNKVVLWKLWFWLAVVLCLHIALGAFLPSAYALTLALLLATLKILKPGIIVHNATELFIYGGLAVIFVPLLTPITALILLLLISVYDMYAVWRSQHMAKMAQFQAQSGIFAGLLLPYGKHRLIFKGPVKKSENVRTAILGGGDIGFPLIFAGVVMKTAGMAPAISIALGATLALLGLLVYGQKNRFYPAMPFLTAGCLLGWLAALLL